MRTRNSNFPNNSKVTIPRRRNRGHAPNIIEPELRTIVEIAPMAESTMEELLRAPTEGYGEAIVLPEINADHFEIKTNLLQLVQANPFYGRESENPHAHINNGAAKTWYEKEPQLDLDLGGSQLTQVDTFYNGLNENEQDSLNAAAGGNILNECYFLVKWMRQKIDSLRSNLHLVEIVSKKVITPAPVKAVEETCVTCSGAHSWYNCPATDNNQASVCATTASTSGTLSSNTIPNPKGEDKIVTILEVGVLKMGTPTIPTNLSPRKIVERETQETTDKEQTNFQGSTAQIPPPVYPIPKPDVPKSLPKTTPIPGI
ncbi:hypothetical protein Tco_0912544 [Tanacetum coccineum]